MTDDKQMSPSNTPTRQTEGMVRCSLTDKEIPAEEAYWAPPLITTGQLISTIANTFVRTPSNLGHILFEEQPDVPYDPEARDELASRRTMEQLKLLLFLLFIAALIAVPFFLILR